MDLGIKGKVALVAGSSRGIGKAVAVRLATEGCIVGLCSRGRTGLEATVDEITRGGGKAWGTVVDMTCPEQVRDWILETQQRFGHVDIAVFNSGGPPAGGALEMELEHWRQAYVSTLQSAVVFARTVAPTMVRRRWGRIINIASISVRQPIDGLVLSNSMRMGVVGFAKTLAREVAADGVTVNTVCPGYTDTERLRRLAQAISQREKVDLASVYDRWTSDIPMRRVARPEEIADLVAFLASANAGYITGTTVEVDGGAVRASL